jgi:hypothetical protein
MKTAVAEGQLREALLRELARLPGAHEVSDLGLCRVDPDVAGYDWTVAMVEGDISDEAAHRLLVEVIPAYQGQYSIAEPLPPAAVE